LISKLIEAIRPDGLIVDPFIGSGTTAVACLASGRRCIGVELDRANFATSVARCERALLRGEDFIPGLDATPKLGQVVPES
jgi:site-specific DNA-methyltransferase (adenine-specific)